jgi:L-rhamnose mutarotase
MAVEEIRKRYRAVDEGMAELKASNSRNYSHFLKLSKCEVPPVKEYFDVSAEPVGLSKLLGG